MHRGPLGGWDGTGVHGGRLPACDDPPCARVCPVEALSLRDAGGVLLDEDRCIGCGHCREACMIGAVFWDAEINKPMICMHCGICAKYCPHGVLVLEKREALIPS